MHSSVDAGSAPDTDAEPTAMASAAAPGVSSSAAVSNGSAAPADSSEIQAYETAYALFKSAKYKDAISHFNKFIKSYPASSYLPSAQYWIGNSYFALRDFKSAITTQEKLLSAYPDSAKAPDAMLNIASSQQEMGKKTAAKKTLETLIARYPGSDAAEKAKRGLPTRSSVLVKSTARRVSARNGLITTSLYLTFRAAGLTFPNMIQISSELVNPVYTSPEYGQFAYQRDILFSAGGNQPRQGCLRYLYG